MMRRRRGTKGTSATADEPVADEPLVGPALTLGGMASAAWREEALTRAAELQGLAEWMKHESELEQHEIRLADQIAGQLERARSTAAQEDNPPGHWWQRPMWRFKRSFGGATLERTLGRLDAVEADLLRLAPDDYVCALMPSLHAHVNRFLPKDDPRRIRLESLVRKAEQSPLTGTERGAAVAAYHAANSQRRRELLRLRTFRNVLVVATLLLLAVAAGLGTLGSIQPGLMPICFTPDNKVVCPTHESLLGTAKSGSTGAGTGQAGQTSSTITATTDIDEAMADTVSRWDLGLVELIGLVSAALASAFALRGIKGTSTPYSLPVALAGLKLATGALTAFLGLMLMRGNFVPGLSALDSSAQILSWAIVFGYAQQLFTRFVDQQAQNVLESVGGRGAAGDRPLAQNTHASA